MDFCYTLLKGLMVYLIRFYHYMYIFQWLKAPLHHATENEHLDIAKYLIEQGALINVKNEVRTHCYLSIVQGKHMFIVFLLLSHVVSWVRYGT